MWISWREEGSHSVGFTLSAKNTTALFSFASVALLKCVTRSLLAASSHRIAQRQQLSASNWLKALWVL